MGTDILTKGSARYTQIGKTKKFWRKVREKRTRSSSRVPREAAAGPSTPFPVGTPVATMTSGGFAEYSLLGAKHVIPVAEATPSTLALLTSGLTASLALEQCGRVRPGETVLVTAAAGGTGQFAVQLARLAGCHVIATCGSADKAAMLTRLGAARVIDYKKDSLKRVLKAEYPKGVDVVYESVGE